MGKGIPVLDREKRTFSEPDKILSSLEQYPILQDSGPVGVKAL